MNDDAVSSSARGRGEHAVALIIFRRPGTTERVLEAIRNYGPKKLYVIADGPRLHKADDSVSVARTRALVDSAGLNCEITKIYSDSNLGLRERVLSGLDQVFAEEDSVIILEDDCLPNQDFFEFADEMLEFFKDSGNVGLISGNNFASNSGMKDSYYFSTHANIWGWATWSRTWREFRESSMEKFLTNEGKAEISKAIPGRHQRKVFLKLLQLAKNLDSWAIQFAAFCYTRGLLSVVPKVNLVSNIGFGVESTHTKFESYVDEVRAEALDFPLRHPDKIEPNLTEMRRESRIKAFGWFIYPLLHPFDFLGRVIRFLKNRSS